MIGAGAVPKTVRRRNGRDMNEFFDKNLKYLWEGNEIFGESTIPVRFGDEIVCRLRFRPEEILRVTDSGVNREFKEGKDFFVRGKELVFAAVESAPAYITEDTLHGRNLPAEIAEDPKQWGFHCLYTDSPFLIRRQLSVTYRYDRREWDFPVPQYPAGALPRVRGKLKRGEPVEILLYGDSISTGANSSAVMGEPPFLPPWYELAVYGLQQKFGSQIRFTNISEPGRTATWAVEQAAQRMKGKRADLMIIAFGMNDASMKLDKEEFLQNIRAIMCTQENKDCEFILVGSIVPNVESGLLGEHRAFAAALRRLYGESVVTADVGALQEYFLKDKFYTDMTGNNVNHPNDFVARMYAMSILNIFEEGKNADQE